MVAAEEGIYGLPDGDFVTFLADPFEDQDDEEEEELGPSQPVRRRLDFV